MLDELHVVNIGVIDDMTIQLGPGMTVISGETGAGKTLIVDALSLLGGQRTDANLIRSGYTTARVEGRFHAADSETVIVRQISASEPSRSYINNSIVRAGDLADLSVDLFHIYGQHDAHLLFSAAAQAATLDSFCSVDYTRLYDAKLRQSQARARLADLGGDERSRQRELFVCQSEFDQIAAVGLTNPEEESQIKAELELLSNAIEFKQSLEQVQAALIEGNEHASAMDQIGEARRLLTHTRNYSLIVDRLSSEIDSLREVGREIRMEIDRLDPDPGRFEQLQERLLELSKIRRRYGDSLREVIDYREKIAKRIEVLSSFELVASRLEKEIERYEVEIGQLESEVLSSRQAGANDFSKGVTERLASLAMPNGRFEVHFGKSATGDPVSFMFSSNSGERLGPVSKVASGGELSRLMLAIRLISPSTVSTMIFDEVDAGIGGKTAVSIGEALAQLSKTKQIIVVTHLAQVASFADRQIAISKEDRNGRTITSGKFVEGEERVSELARMLSGHNDSVKARDHAREMLSRAGKLEI